MSGLTRPARAEELVRLWPLVRSAHLVPDFDALAAMHTDGPWQVRVSDDGDVLVLGRWRVQLDVLAIRGAWAPEHRIGGLVSDARAVARSQGLGRVLSPLLEQQHSRVYRGEGMVDLERLVACTASVATVADMLESRSAASSAIRLRAATTLDVELLTVLDEACFDEFWRHGEEEIEDAIRKGHVMVAVVAEDDGDVTGAYAVSLLSGSTVTIGRLAVALPHRRGGLATTLLEEAARWAREQGARGLSLCTQAHNYEARALYRSAGFRELSDDYRLLIMDADG